MIEIPPKVGTCTVGDVSGGKCPTGKASGVKKVCRDVGGKHHVCVYICPHVATGGSPGCPGHTEL